ncbi:Hypothetical predicted protein [Mytilus galloprovincialis]|uniref:Uncharacterized protein n=1 Tax=Mytilus galloprovincialis TaxID=29158 RepID=A0A8B6BSJ2_MYTGA|nr:Hypothetical predicted protein [Mytilus galloprovincialis]
MRHQPSFFHVLQLLLYFSVKDVCTQGNIKNVVVEVLKSNCTANGGNKCIDEYLQICYDNNQEDIECRKRMTLFCFEPTDHNIKKTDLKAIDGSKLRYEFFEEMSRIKDIKVGITSTPTTLLYPMATSCETTRSNTTNGFKVNTNSADGIYKFEILIEVECTTSTCGGQNCEICGLSTFEPTEMVSTSVITTTVPTEMVSTSISMTTETVSTSIISSSPLTTLSTLLSTSFLTFIVTNNRTINNFNKSTSNLRHSDNPASDGNQTITVIVISVASIFVIVIVLILIFICYRKHNRKTKTTPAEDDKNYIENEYTEGEDRHFSTDYSNGLQHNKVNLHIENEACDASKKNEIENDQNNGYTPDDENSDVELSKENEEQNTRKSDEVSISSSVDNQENDNQEIDSNSKSNSHNADIQSCKSIEDEDIGTSNEVKKNGAMINSHDVSGNDVPSSDNGDIALKAQFNGEEISSHQEISKNDIENINQAIVETFMHGKMSEMRRDLTEHTNNNINQVREEVMTFQHDITERMAQQSNEFKEEINKTTEDSEKAERKRQRKMQKLRNQIQECNERLRMFEDRSDEYIPNQKLLEEELEASGGKHDVASSEIIENNKEIQSLRDEMNRLNENLTQQISQQRGVISGPDTTLVTRTQPITESSPHSNDLLRSKTANDDALNSRHSGPLAPDQYSELKKKRKKKKKRRTPSIRFPGDGNGTVHIQHEDNTIAVEQIGPMEVQQTNRGIRLTGGNVEIDIKSPRKKKSSPQKDQSN